MLWIVFLVLVLVLVLVSRFLVLFIGIHINTWGNVRHSCHWYWRLCHSFLVFLAILSSIMRRYECMWGYLACGIEDGIQSILTRSRWVSSVPMKITIKARRPNDNDKAPGWSPWLYNIFKWTKTNRSAAQCTDIAKWWHVGIDDAHTQYANFINSISKYR